MVHIGCNIPNASIAVEVLTAKDKRDLAFIAKLNPEFVAASFIGSAEDVQKVVWLL
jgi:pyruvate kinase